MKFGDGARSRSRSVPPRIAAVLCLAGILGGCATPEPEWFIARYRLDTKVGPLYELVADGRSAGWLYGAVHYGTIERPSLSQAAVRALAQTRHVYFERTDRAGNSWPMRDAHGEDLDSIARAKRKSAMASPERVRQGLMAAKNLEQKSEGVAVVLSQDLAFYRHWALANNYCGVFYEYGTERLVRDFSAGRDITIHSLESDASRRAALEQARAERCRPADADGPSSSTNGLATLGMDDICRRIQRDVALDQLEGRAGSVSTAAACVLDSRHRTMSARIAQAAKAGEHPFVIVGRGHLMPGQNLIDLLAEQGLALQRLD